MHLVASLRVLAIFTNNFDFKCVNGYSQSSIQLGGKVHQLSEIIELVIL